MDCGVMDRRYATRLSSIVRVGSGMPVEDVVVQLGVYIAEVDGQHFRAGQTHAEQMVNLGANSGLIIVSDGRCYPVEVR